MLLVLVNLVLLLTPSVNRQQRQALAAHYYAAVSASQPVSPLQRSLLCCVGTVLLALALKVVAGPSASAGVEGSGGSDNAIAHTAAATAVHAGGTAAAGRSAALVEGTATAAGAPANGIAVPANAQTVAGAPGAGADAGAAAGCDAQAYGSSAASPGASAAPASHPAGLSESAQQGTHPARAYICTGMGEARRIACSRCTHCSCVCVISLIRARAGGTAASSTSSGSSPSGSSSSGSSSSAASAALTSAASTSHGAAGAAVATAGSVSDATQPVHGGESPAMHVLDVPPATSVLRCALACLLGGVQVRRQRRALQLCIAAPWWAPPPFPMQQARCTPRTTAYVAPQQVRAGACRRPAIGALHCPGASMARPSLTFQPCLLADDLDVSAVAAAGGTAATPASRSSTGGWRADGTAAPAP